MSGMILGSVNWTMYSDLSVLYLHWLIRSINTRDGTSDDILIQGFSGFLGNISCDNVFLNASFCFTEFSLELRESSLALIAASLNSVVQSVTGGGC